MSKLINDMFIRNTGKLTLLALVSCLTLLCVYVGVVIILGLTGRINSDWAYVYASLKFLTSSFKSDFSAFVAVAVGVFPTIVSSVCYKVNRTIEPYTMTDYLNRTGHVFFILLVLGLIFSIIDVALLTDTVDDGSRSVGNLAYRDPLKNLFTGILSFYTIYLVQLVGLKLK